MNVEVLPSIHWGRVQVDEPLQTGWERIRRGHGCPVHENRDGRNTVRQCRLDLNPYIVFRVAHPLLPCSADDGKQDVATMDLLGQELPKVHAERDRVHVEKDRFLPESMDKVVVDPPRYAGGVRPMIRDEDLRHSLYSFTVTPLLLISSREPSPARHESVPSRSTP